jgi:predicted DNA-binding protein
MQTERLYLRISPELKQALEVMAKKNRRQLSDYVRLLLEDHVATKEKINGSK